MRRYFFVWEIHYCSAAAIGTRFNFFLFDCRSTTQRNTYKRFHFDKMVRRSDTDAIGGARVFSCHYFTTFKCVDDDERR